MSIAAVPSPSSPSVVAALLPLMAVVLIAFLVIGVAMPVLPLHVHDGLGFGPFMVGLVAGCQFAAALVARVWAGRTADAHGAKRAVVAGLAAATVAGLLYRLSLNFVGVPRVSVGILLAGRAVLGGAESFIITGATTWGLARVGARNAGTVIAWLGTAMFAAFAGGAPLGADLYGRGGFAAVALATVLAPLATLLLIAPVHGDAPAHQGSANVLSVVRRIWLPGLGAALASIGFGAIVTFASLLFVAHDWTPVWLAFTSYAVALIAARLLFGHLPDRIGGAKVALLFVLIETAGLALMGLASSAGAAAVGAALTGLGYSLVFPGLGVEAVRRAPPESRGVAMGAYTACLDLALGVSGPALGLVAGKAGVSAVFLVSALIVLGAAPIAIRLLRTVGSVSALTGIHETRSYRDAGHRP
jgi:MFS family permease